MWKMRSLPLPLSGDWVSPSSRSVLREQVTTWATAVQAALVPELMKALSLDELLLVTHDETVAGRVGTPLRIADGRLTENHP